MSNDDDNGAENGVLIDDLGDTAAYGDGDGSADETAQFAALQRTMRTEAGALDLADDYENNVALFVYDGAHETPPNDLDPLAQIMQSADKQFWYVFDKTSTSDDDEDDGESARDCRAPLVHFDADDMPVCHRRIERKSVGEAIYLALWLAAQRAPDAAQLSAFVTGYKVFRDDRETPEASILASAVLDAEQVLKDGDASAADNSANEGAENERVLRNSRAPSARLDGVPTPASRTWMLWLIGGTVLLLVAAITIYFVALRKRARSRNNNATTDKDLRRAPSEQAQADLAAREVDELARSTAESREENPLFGNV